MPIANVPPTRGVESLSTADCWRLLENRSIGRMAVAGEDNLPDVFPINYRVHDGCLYLRTGPGTKLASIASRPLVAFEIDGQDSTTHWSVVVKGRAERLDADADIRASGVEAMASAVPTPTNDFVRITASSVTGRRFRKRLPDVGDPRGEGPLDPIAAVPWSSGVPETARPVPRDRPAPVAGPDVAPPSIPHYPPRSAD